MKWTRSQWEIFLDILEVILYEGIRPNSENIFPPSITTFLFIAPEPRSGTQ